MGAFQFYRRICLAAGLALLSGCQSDVAVRPPDQQGAFLRTEPLGSFVSMNQPDAARYFLSGVYSLEAGTWRWAGRAAKVRLHLKETENLNFVMKFAVPGAVIARHGPVRLRILINDTPWEELRYESDGIYEIAKPVPSKLLKPAAENIVTAEIDKPLPSDGKGPELGFILVHLGFRPAA